MARTMSQQEFAGQQTRAQQKLPTIKYSKYITKWEELMGLNALDPKLYRHAQKPGKGPGDYTSFLPSQQDWGEDRSHRPSILFQIRQTEEQKQLKHPTDLIYTDTADNVTMVVVSDFTNLPLRYYQDLPDKISTMVEGWLLEAWFRLNPDLTLDDILDRMPNLNRDAAGREKLRKNMTEKRTAFRLKARCISWSINGSQNAMKDRELQHLLLLPQNHDCLRQNTTIDLEDRTIQELRQLKQKTKASGKYGASKRRPGADTARNTRKQVRHASPTTSVPQPNGNLPSCITPEASLSKDAPMESGKKRKWHSSYPADEEASRAKPPKRQQQVERTMSYWQAQDYGYSTPSTTHAWLDDEAVDDGGATFPVNGGAQTHVNAVFTAGADVSDEEFQRQIDCIMHEIPSWMESPGTAASGGPLTPRSSAILTPEMLSLPQPPRLSLSQGSDTLPAETATPPSTMALLRQWDPMFAGMYPAQGPSSVYEHDLF